MLLCECFSPRHLPLSIQVNMDSTRALLLRPLHLCSSCSHAVSCTASNNCPWAIFLQMSILGTNSGLTSKCSTLVDSSVTLGIVSQSDKPSSKHFFFIFKPTSGLNLFNIPHHLLHLGYFKTDSTFHYVGPGLQNRSVSSMLEPVRILNMA